MQVFKLGLVAILMSAISATQAQTVQVDSISLVPEASVIRAKWEESKEVVEVKTWPTIKRIAVTRYLIWRVQKNKADQLQNVEKKKRLSAVLSRRIFAYSHLKELLKDSADEIGMKDYLDGEIADMNLTLNNKIPYVMYVKAQSQREDKLAYLYMRNEEFIKELVKFDVEKDLVVAMLANKTYAMAVIQSCSQSMDACRNL